MTYWERKYYLLKTQSSNETIGFVSLRAPSIDSNIYNFSLLREGHEFTPGEFMDLNNQEIDLAEWETHVDVFKSAEALEVVEVRETTSSTAVLVRKVNTERTEETDDADNQAEPKR